MKTNKGLGMILIILVSWFITAGSTLITPGNESEIQENNQKKPIIHYIVDGKPMSAKEADKIDPGKIEKMEFIKEKEKIRKYTDEEVDMVVLITMKKSEEKDTNSVGNGELEIKN